MKIKIENGEIDIKTFALGVIAIDLVVHMGIQLYKTAIDAGRKYRQLSIERKKEIKKIQKEIKKIKKEQYKVESI